MTITVLPARNEYTANAGQTIFNYTFKIFSDTDLNVYITPAGKVADDDTQLTTAYTVTGIGDEDGGSITLMTGTNQEDLVTIVSNVPSSRVIDYQNNGDFRPVTVNSDFDRVVSIAKKIEDTANRTLLLQQSQQDPKPLDLPLPLPGYILRWKTDRTGMENVMPKDAGIDIASVTDLEAIARALNILDSQVIYASDTVTLLDDVLYIYDASAQKTLGKPIDVGSGEAIVSIAGTTLTTTGGTYELTTINRAGLVFETIADVGAGRSVGGIVELLIGDSLSTLDYATGNNSGTLFFRVVAGGTGIDDGGSYIDLSSGLQLMQSFGNDINVKAFGAFGNAFSDSFEISSGGKPYNELRQLNAFGWNDDSDALQAAIDYANRLPMFNKTLTFPPGGYAITKPLLINHADGLIIQGAGRMSSCLVPVGDMVPVLNDAFILEQSIQDDEFPNPEDPGVHYDTEKACIMVASGRRTLSSSFAKQYGRAAWLLTFRDIGMSGFASTELCSFIYGSEFAHSYISNIYIEFGHCLLKVWDMYRVKFTQCDVQQSYTPIDHYSPLAPENSPEGGTGSSTGTSVHFDCFGAATVTKGFFLRHLSYSSMTACTLDGWGWQPDGVYDPLDDEIKYAYTIERCVGFTMTSCGCESARPSEYLNSAAFNIYGADEGQMNITGGTYLQEFRDDYTGRPNIFSGLDLKISGPLLSSGGQWLIKRGQVYLDGFSYDLPVDFFECEDWVLRKPGATNSETRFNPTIVPTGRNKAAVGRYNFASTELDPVSDFVTFDRGDSATGYDEYDWGIMGADGKSLIIPFSGWFFIGCSISYTGINSSVFSMALTRTDATTQTLCQSRLVSAAGDTTLTGSARFNKGDVIRVNPNHTGSGGFILRVSTSLFQL